MKDADDAGHHRFEQPEPFLPNCGNSKSECGAYKCNTQQETDCQRFTSPGLLKCAMIDPF